METEENGIHIYDAILMPSFRLNTAALSLVRDLDFDVVVI